MALPSGRRPAGPPGGDSARADHRWSDGPPVTGAFAEDPGQAVLVPHWLSAPDRAEVRRAVEQGLAAPLHPVVAVLLGDVLTELHVAAARELVWPAPITRVRRATGWATDVLPVRLTAAELTSVLSLPGLSTVARAALSAGRSA